MPDQASLERSLIQALEAIPVIDCHEHMSPESERISRPVDVFTLFSHYTWGDLYADGMSEQDYLRTQDTNLPLDYRWSLLAPHWENIRWSSYARAALLAARKFCGVDDINEHTYVAISEALQKHNTKGLYQRVLGEACNIRASLTQCGKTGVELGPGLLTSVMPMTHGMESWEALTTCGQLKGAVIRTLDDYVEAMHAYVVRVKSEGTVGLKMMSNPYGNPDRSAALAAFNSLRDGTERSLPAVNPLRDYVVDQVVGFAGQEDLVVAVHTGYWGDFRVLNPTHMIPLLQRHPKTRFDLYHLGYPYVRESLMIGKTFVNAWLNLAWTHIISQQFATEALDEAVDLVPMSKLLGFGGDYHKPVEKAYGHMVMAREDIARVLARRILEGRWSEEQALAVARKWLWDNPKELYRLKTGE